MVDNLRNEGILSRIPMLDLNHYSGKLESLLFGDGCPLCALNPSSDKADYRLLLRELQDLTEIKLWESGIGLPEAGP